MEIYNNDYTKDEDFMLWELHETREKIWKNIKNKSSDEINEMGQFILNNWKKERELIGFK